MVVNEKPHLFPGVVEAQEPLEEQGQERRGLFDEHTDQDCGQGFILHREGSAEESSHVQPLSPQAGLRDLEPKAEGCGLGREGAWAREL